MTYAAYTKVPVDKTRAEIEGALKKAGAKSFAYFTEEGRAIVVFEIANRRVRFDLPLPAEEATKEARIRRERWRALLLCIKAKLESVASKIETFEEAFLAHIVLPDGMKVGQHTHHAIASAYKDGKMVPLLPAPTKAAP